MVQVSWADLDEEALEVLMFLREREVNVCLILSRGQYFLSSV